MHRGRAVLATNCALAGLEMQRGRPLNSIVRAHVTKPGTLVSTQTWKLWLGFGTLAVSAAFMWAPRMFFSDSTVGTLVGTAIGLASFSWLAIAIWCPGCHLRLFWYAVSKKGINEWLGWLLDASECPRCGWRQRT